MVYLKKLTVQNKCLRLEKEIPESKIKGRIQFTGDERRFTEKRDKLTGRRSETLPALSIHPSLGTY